MEKLKKEIDLIKYSLSEIAIDIKEVCEVVKQLNLSTDKMIKCLNLLRDDVENQDSKIIVHEHILKELNSIKVELNVRKKYAENCIKSFQKTMEKLI